MRTSATCLRVDHASRAMLLFGSSCIPLRRTTAWPIRSRDQTFAAVRNDAGFTLVELLVVLTIIGLIAGISLPRLTALYASMENSGQRTAIVDQIEGLGYRAYASGRPIVLESPRGAQDPTAKSPLQLPRGWRIDVQKSVRYSALGTCTGGKLTLSDPEGGTQAFRLSPPLCRLERDSGEP